MGHGAGSSERLAGKHRFLIELWLEPREVATKLLRLRGRMRDLATDTQQAVAGIDDVNSFIHDSFAAGTNEPFGWEDKA